MPTIEIPYNPRQLQYQIHKNLKRWNVLVLHRRAGKTVLCINQLIADALRNDKENPRYAYIAPLYKQAKAIAWDYLKHYTNVIPGRKFNESELRVDLPNGARISLYGADNPDALRGVYLDGVILDEYAQMNPKMWSEVIRPALSDRKGYAIFIGTPKGKNSFYDLYKNAINNDSWMASMYKASETGLIDKEELLDARRSMSEDEYAQEYECSWEAAIKGAYWAKQIKQMRDEQRICKVPYEKELLVHTAWDLGAGKKDAMAVVFFQIFGKEIRIIDHEERLQEGLPYFVRILEDKGYNYGTHYAPHDVAIREIGTGKTRLEQAEEYGLYFETVPRVERKMDSIELVRNMMNRFYIDEKLDYLIECMTQYKAKYNEEKQILSGEPDHDWTSHTADAIQGMAMAIKRDFTVSYEDSYDEEEIYDSRLG